MQRWAVVCESTSAHQAGVQPACAVVSLWRQQSLCGARTYLCRCRCNPVSGRFPTACSASCICPPGWAGKQSRDCYRLWAPLFCKVSPMYQLSFWIFLNSPWAGKSISRQSRKSSQLAFPFKIKWFLYKGNVLSDNKLFLFLFHFKENCSLFTSVLALQEKDHLKQRKKMGHIFLRNLSLYK